MDDILAVIWKERKGLFSHQGSRRGVVFSLSVFVAMMGILLPFQMGRDYASSPLALAGVVVVPALLVAMKIPDSFAGEREQHTLATLLASRLPDQAILYGKVLTAIVYGWVTGLAVFLVGLVTANILHWEGRLLLCSPKIALLGPGLGLLLAALVAGLGVFISLRSATVQNATQTLMFGILAVPMALQVVAAVALGGGPRGREFVKSLLRMVGSTEFILVTIVLLVVATGALQVLARVRFRRGRLMVP